MNQFKPILSTFILSISFSLIGNINQKGLTIVPTKMYFKKGKVKLQIAVAKGKKLFDKRNVKKKREWDREKAKLFSKNNK